MKIVDLKVHIRKIKLAEPFAFSQGWFFNQGLSPASIGWRC